MSDHIQIIINIKKIIVATDGSDTSKRAVDYAIDLARKYNAKLVILHVLNLIIPGSSGSSISDKLDEKIDERPAFCCRMPKRKQKKIVLNQHPNL